MTARTEINTPMLTTIFHHYLGDDRRKLGAFLLLILAAGFLTAIAPLLFSSSIDSMVAGSPTTALIFGFVSYCLVYALGRAAGKVTSYIAAIRAEKLKFIVSTRFFKRVLRKDVSFLSRYNGAEIQGALEAGQRGFSIIYQLMMTVFLPGIIEVGISLWLMSAFIDVNLALIVAAYGAVVIWLTHLANTRTQTSLHAAIGSSQRNAQFVGNVVAALEPLKFYQGFNWAEKRFTENAAEVQQSWTVYGRKRVLFSLIMAGGLATQLAINFVLIIPQFQAQVLTVGDVVLFNALLLQLNVPFELVGQSMEQVLRAKGDLKPFHDIWTFDEDRLQGNGTPPPRDEMSICFDKVSYQYEGGKGICDLSFKVPPTGLTFITGPTGSGKSTVFRLLMRQLSPQSGRILLGSVDIADIDPTTYFDLVALVPQDIVLLNDTIAENISFGRDGEPGALHKAARMAQIDEMVESLPHGYDTQVGERGAFFSGGERQRIAVARALYGNPGLLLLDEASSALDANTEDKIFETVRELARSIPVIAITHHKEIIRKSDYVIDLENPMHNCDEI